MPRCYHSISRRSGSSERAGWCIKEMGRLQEALQAYDEIIGSFSPNYFALCGRAEVLKEMERFNDARIAYEETITRFPQASIALCGRASVLERGKSDRCPAGVRPGNAEIPARSCSMEWPGGGSQKTWEPPRGSHGIRKGPAEIPR